MKSRPIMGCLLLAVAATLLLPGTMADEEPPAEDPAAGRIGTGNGDLPEPGVPDKDREAELGTNPFAACKFNDTDVYLACTVNNIKCETEAPCEVSVTDYEATHAATDPDANGNQFYEFQITRVDEGPVTDLCYREWDPDIQWTEVKLPDTDDLVAKIRKFPIETLDSLDPPPPKGTTVDLSIMVYLDDQVATFPTNQCLTTASANVLLADALASMGTVYEVEDYFYVTMVTTTGETPTRIGLRSKDPRIEFSEISLEPNTPLAWKNNETECSHASDWEVEDPEEEPL